MSRYKTKDVFFLLIQIATVSVFLGRAWQHLFWDAPFRTLLWDEQWMRGIVETWTRFSWDQYITNNQVDDSIQNIIQGFGWFYLVCGFVAIFIRRITKSVGWILWLGSLSLCLLAALYCKEKFFSTGQFLEYALQFSTPFFLYLVCFSSVSKDRLILAMKIALALTFVCHGLYAVNYYPRPGNFVQMVIDILGVGESTAFALLDFAGYVDFLLAILIFLPYKISRWALLYAFGWGLATSVARVWANFYWDFPLESLHQWGFEMVLRLPHALIPLAIWWGSRK